MRFTLRALAHPWDGGAGIHPRSRVGQLEATQGGGPRGAPQGLAEPFSHPGPPSLACLTLPGWTRAPAIHASWRTPESPSHLPKCEGSALPWRGPTREPEETERSEQAGIQMSHHRLLLRTPGSGWPCHCRPLGDPGTGMAVRAQRPGWSVLGLEIGTKARTLPSLAGLYTAHRAEEHHCPGGPAPAHSPGHPACVSPQCPGHRTSPRQNNPRAATCGCFLGTRPVRPQRSQEPARLSTGTGRATARSQTQAHSPAADPRPEPCLV